MASIRQKTGSKYWFACFKLPNGKRAQLSTKETDRKKAQKLADSYEEVARGQMTVQQVQRVLSGIVQQITGTNLPSSTVRAYFHSWLQRKKPETSASTFRFYDGKAVIFLKWLGERADLEIARISTADVVAFRAHETGRVSPATVNHEVKFLRMVFEQAKRDGLLVDNPAEAVKLVKRNERNLRRPFTLPEIKRLLSVADEEWTSLILFGLYTGQRLGDLGRLTWANIDLEHDEIRFRTSKTGRQQIIPLAAPLRRHIENLAVNDDPRQSLHPRAFASLTKSKKAGTLSRQFYEVMVDAGLAAAKKHRATEESTGRNGRRDISEISFHALRHTATSLMKNAGISPAIVQDIIGHDSKEMSDHYTHIDISSKKKAVSSMPDVTVDLPVAKGDAPSPDDSGN